VSRNTAPAGWFPDPLRRFEERFWDGLSWTTQVRSDNVESRDHLMAAARHRYPPPRVVGSAARVGPFGLLCRWMSRIMMMWAVVAMPGALAVGAVSSRGNSYPWVPYAIGPLGFIAALAGLHYSFRHWTAPPKWARALARCWDEPVTLSEINERSR